MDYWDRKRRHVKSDKLSSISYAMGQKIRKRLLLRSRDAILICSAAKCETPSWIKADTFSVSTAFVVDEMMQGQQNWQIIL
jgi:hypothetical protein